ncbi:TonB-dependent receptor [Novosphingobium sp. P6W]|uniref:TonB-dependent receptor n=1 Tax=Novosphingobium sp. P6W TaxID=1609758 RepID=UPI0013B3ACEB|nr:TonB-dependent receptor [Novosphingobium sp. P6W]
MHKLTAALLASSILASVASPALAQATDASGTTEGAGNEIIVTAQKRSERLQDVPLAITAVTGDSLAERNITDTTSLQKVSPTLTYTQGTNPSNSTFRIRGIGTQVFGQGSEPAVSTVIDGVVMARQAQGFSDLADIERVEVLRGPQGTLFGKNASGGVISIVTARPTDVLSGKVQATIAEMGEYHLNGTVSGPINDAVGVRLTGYYNKDDGYIHNVVLGDKVNGYESWGVRGKVEFKLGDLNLLASGSYNKNNADCCQSVAIRTDNANLASLMGPVVAGPKNDEVSTNLSTVSKTSSQIYSLEGSYDLGATTITSITAYQKYSFYNNQDVDGLNTPVPIYTGLNGNAPAYAQFDVNGGPFTLNQWTQELRLGSNGNHDLNYVVGLFYSDLHLDRAFSRRIVSCPTSNPLNQGLAIGAACPAPVGASGSHAAELDSSHIAAFGQADYRIVGGLKVVGGIRLQREKLKVDGHQNAAALVGGDTPAFSGATLTSGTTKASDDAITGKAGLQYEFSRNAQVYASYTRGYKGQSLGTEYNQTFNNNPVVAPEKVNAYEIGFKGATSDGKLRVAAAAFLADYTDLQVQANRSDQSTGNFLFVVTNAGKAQTKGVEVEATFQPDDHFSLGVNMAYVKGTFDADGLACPLSQRVGTPIIAVGQAVPANTCARVQTSNGAGGTVTSGPQQNIRGGMLPNTPRWRIGFNPRYEHEIGAYLGYIDLSLAYQSDVTFSLEQDPLLKQDGYPIVDATIGIRAQDKGFNASVFVKNMFNQNYYANVANGTTLTSQMLTPNNLTAFRPKGAFRYFGASMGYKF